MIGTFRPPHSNRSASTTGERERVPSRLLIALPLVAARITHLSISTTVCFGSHQDRSPPTIGLQTGGGRVGYIVIVDPITTDHGTVYRPKDPLGEFIRLTNQVEDPSLGPPTPPGGLGGTYPGKPGPGPTR